MMLVAAFVSFASFMFILWHIPAKWFRRLMGYKGWVDLVMHTTVLWMFFATSTMGLLQAEAACIMFSVYMRFYAYLKLTQRWSWRYMTWYDIKPGYWRNRRMRQVLS